MNMPARFQDRKQTIGRKLGILLLSDRETKDLQTIEGLCQAAAEMGVEVEIFLMGDGVNRLGSPQLAAMANGRAKISFCALNAMERCLDQQPQYPWGLEEGTQYQLACIVERSDRFIAFT